MNTSSRGYIHAFGAAIALSASFVFSKSVLNQISILQFGALWFSLGIAWNGIWFLISGERKALKGRVSKKHLTALLIAVLEGAATGLFYLAIREMENPAVVSFIGNIGPVLVTIMGVLFLRERFRGLQLAGVLITILGVLLINYREGGFSGFMDPGAIYVLCAAFLFSLATIFGRRLHRHLLPGYMSLLRSGLMALVMILLLLLSGEWTRMDLSLWRDIATGSFLETFVVIVLAYQALKLIEATRTSLIISSKGVWTLLLAWVFLGVFPGDFELAGGILTLVGVWMITWRRKNAH